MSNNSFNHAPAAYVAVCLCRLNSGLTTLAVLCACVKCVFVCLCVRTVSKMLLVKQVLRQAPCAHLSQRDLCSECTHGTSLCVLQESCAACSCDCNGCTWRAFQLWAGVSVNHQHIKHQQRLNGNSIISLRGFHTKLMMCILEAVQHFLQVEHVNWKWMSKFPGLGE